MYVLYGAPPAFGVWQASPFSIKAHHLLVLSGVPFRFEGANPTAGPRKKIPWLVCPDGTVLSDTRNIQRHLERAAGLVLARTPQTRLVLRLVEEHLYWTQVYFRWTHHPKAVRDELFGSVPWPIRPLVFTMVERQVRRDLWSQGLGRRPESEILELVEDDLETLELALGDATFFGGEALSDADLSFHGLMEQVVGTRFDDPLVHCFCRRTALMVHRGRVAAAVVPPSGGLSCSTPS